MVDDKVKCTEYFVNWVFFVARHFEKSKTFIFFFLAHHCSKWSPWMLSASTPLPPPLSPSVPPSQVFQQWQRSSRMWQGVLGPEGQRGAVWAPHPPTAQLPRLLWTPSQGRCVCARLFVHVRALLSPLLSVELPCLSLLLSDVVMVVPMCLCVQSLYDLGRRSVFKY